MAEGDIEALLGIYDPEAVVLTQSGEVKKGQGLREQLAKSAAAKTQFGFNIRQVIQSGDIALNSSRTPCNSRATATRAL